MNRFLSTLLLLFLGLTVYSNELTGKVVHISDGDTITVLDQTRTSYKIRLYGIDAPESKQAFGNVSKQHLGTLLKSGTVKVEWKTKDKYGRILGTVYVNDLNINLKMIQDGMVWHYKRFDSTKSFANAETSAKE